MSDKFQYLGGGPGEYESFLFWILDQRRYIAVQGNREILPQYDCAIDILDKCADDLLPDDVMIKVSDNGERLTFSNNDMDDEGPFFQYPHFDDQPSDVKADTVKRSDLREEQRLYWLADIVTYVNSEDTNHLAVLKIAVHFSQLPRMWNDAHIMRALKGHPALVPFEKFVVDDTENRLVGWTSTFIAGGTLEDNHAFTYFRLSWLVQMTEIIDDINLKYGIMHRDIAARNFLIDPRTKRLLLFDFNNAMRIGDATQNPKFLGPPDVDGIVFTIYELLTFDKSCRACKPCWLHEVSPIEEMAEWPVKAKLEPGLDVATIRRHLDCWVQERRTVRSIKHFTEATHPIALPKMPDETDEPMYFDKEDGRMAEVCSQGHARMGGVHYVDWMRPPLQKISREYYVPTLSLRDEEEISQLEKE